MTAKFIEILNRVKPEILENPDTDLVEGGIIDSLDIMNLIAELESGFGIDFDPDDIVPEAFASAAAIWEVARKYQEVQEHDAD